MYVQRLKSLVHTENGNRKGKPLPRNEEKSPHKHMETYLVYFDDHRYLSRSEESHGSSHHWNIAFKDFAVHCELRSLEHVLSHPCVMDCVINFHELELSANIHNISAERSSGQVGATPT